MIPIAKAIVTTFLVILLTGSAFAQEGRGGIVGVTQRVVTLKNCDSPDAAEKVACGLARGSNEVMVREVALSDARGELRELVLVALPSTFYPGRDQLSETIFFDRAQRVLTRGADSKCAPAPISKEEIARGEIVPNADGSVGVALCDFSTGVLTIGGLVFKDLEQPIAKEILAAGNRYFIRIVDGSDVAAPAIRNGTSFNGSVVKVLDDGFVTSRQAE